MVLCHLRRFLSNSSTTIYERLLLSASLEGKMATKCISSRADSNQNLKNMVKYNPVTHVIFDMDGLLLDTETLYQEVHQIICSEFGKNFNYDMQVEILGRFRNDAVQYIITTLDLPISVDEYVSRALQLYKEIFPKSKLQPETETLYQEIHQIICSEFGKNFNFDLHMEIQGRFRNDAVQHIITTLDLPISVDEYVSRALQLYKEIFPKSKLKPDTEIIYKRIISEIAESYGKKYTRDIQLKVLGTTEQATASVVIKECGLPLTVNEFLDDFHKKQKTSLANAGLMEGAERLVRHFYNQKVPIAIATSSGKEAVEIKTKNHKELFKLFHHVVMGSSDPDVKKGKPAPDIFQVCAQRFEDKPSFDKCLVFEDAPNGVTGAVAAGMQTVMVPDPELPLDKTSHATVVLKSLIDFKPEEFGLPAF